MRNRTIINTKILHIPLGHLSKYPPSELSQMLADITAELEFINQAKERIESAINIKYKKRIHNQRLLMNKNTGVIHIQDGKFRLINDVFEQIEWDQSKLKQIVVKLLMKGVNVDQFVDTIYQIPECRFSKWSYILQTTFAPARIIKFVSRTNKLTKCGHSDFTHPNHQLPKTTNSNQSSITNNGEV